LGTDWAATGWTTANAVAETSVVHIARDSLFICLSLRSCRFLPRTVSTTLHRIAWRGPKRFDRRSSEREARPVLMRVGRTQATDACTPPPSPVSAGAGSLCLQ